MKQHDKYAMDTNMGAETITARIGAASLPLGVILFVVATAFFHPSRENPMNNVAVFMEYAENDSWVLVHFVQWLAALLISGGLVSLYYSITTTPQRESSAGVARFGLAA